jgi:hypothetical protein
LSTLLSAVASLISVAIAAYLVIQGKRESPDIKFVSLAVTIDSSFMSKTELETTCRLLFQNVGARAGSLIDIKLDYPLRTDSGGINGVGDLEPNVFPLVIRPYAAEIIHAKIMLRGNPNLKTLLVNLGAEARIGVKYHVSTKPKRNATTGIQEHQSQSAPSCTAFRRRSKRVLFSGCPMVALLKLLRSS